MIRRIAALAGVAVFSLVGVVAVATPSHAMDTTWGCAGRPGC